MRFLRLFAVAAIVIAVDMTGLAAVASSATCAIVDTINASGVITVTQPAALSRLLVRQHTVTGDESTSDKAPHQAVATSRTGYRVQVYDDNNPRTARRNAEAYHARMTAEFPYMKTYVSFNSPYWCVKAGDFRTRAEAEAAMAEIRRAFPALSAYLRVIRDRINVID